MDFWEVLGTKWRPQKTRFPTSQPSITAMMLANRSGGRKTMQGHAIVLRLIAVGSLAASLAVATSLLCGQGPSKPGLASIPRYTLDIHLRPANHSMHVAGSVELPPLPTQRPPIRLSLDSAAANVSFEMGALPTDKNAFTLTSHKGEDGNVEWSLRPNHSIAPGRSVHVGFSYDIEKPVGQLFYPGPEVSMASGWGMNWYPVVVEGASKGVGMLRIVCPPGWTAVAGNRSLATRVEEKGGIFRFQIDHPTFF